MDGYDHAANWYAFAIALLTPLPCSIESAFELYYTGKPRTSMLGRAYDRYRQIDSLVKSGMSWQRIAAVMHLKNINSARATYAHGKSRYGEIIEEEVF